MTDDQKPMSAEEVASQIVEMCVGVMNDDTRTRIKRKIATALRDHAAEAVEAERERIAKIADAVSAQASVMRSMDAKGRRDAAAEIAAAARARTEGGEGDG